MDKAVLIRKVLMNEASEEERGELNAWIARDPDHAEEFEDLKLLYEERPGYNEPEQEEEFYEPLKKIQASIKKVKQKERQVRFYKTAGISLAVYCLVFVAVVYFFNSYKVTSNESADLRADKGTLSGLTLPAELKFKDAPMSAILRVIGEKNNIMFAEVAEELLRCRFTGTFCKGAAIGDVMDALAESENFQYVVTVDKVVLTGKGCLR